MKVRITKAGLFGSDAFPVGEEFTLGENVSEFWASYYEVIDGGAEFIVNPAAEEEAPKLEDMTVAELKDFSELNSIEIGDATKKADILAAIELALTK